MDNEELKMLTFLYFDSYTHNRKSNIDEDKFESFKLVKITKI